MNIEIQEYDINSSGRMNKIENTDIFIKLKDKMNAMEVSTKTCIFISRTEIDKKHRANHIITKIREHLEKDGRYFTTRVFTDENKNYLGIRIWRLK